MELFPDPPDLRNAQKIAGIDEVGRGCLAGPVVAAAVILPPCVNLPGLADSKQLSPTARKKLDLKIRQCALAWSLGLVWPKEIDKINILQATLLAMAKSACLLKVEPEKLVIDGNSQIPCHVLAGLWSKRKGSRPPSQQAIVRGDQQVAAISAASIVAKTFRDRLMGALDKVWPGYDFIHNKGYGAPKHLEALKKLGPTPMHRLTFNRVAHGNPFFDNRGL